MVIIIILVLLIIFLSYLLILSLRRIQNYENFILQISQIVEFASKKIKQVDVSGHYEADDETGFFFTQLKQIQELLENIFEGDDDAKKE
jgi:hypothetical protein